MPGGAKRKRRPRPLLLAMGPGAPPVEVEVAERMGYSHSAGAYCAAVVFAGAERMAVAPSPRGPWRLWGPRDRVSEADRAELARLAAGGAPRPRTAL